MNVYQTNYYGKILWFLLNYHDLCHCYNFCQAIFKAILLSILIKYCTIVFVRIFL